MVGRNHRVDDEIDGNIVEIARGNLFAPRTAVLILGNLPDGTETFAHEEEVSAFPCFTGDSGDNGPELLGGGEICDFLVVREAPVLVTGIKVPQHPRVREWCGIGNGGDGRGGRKGRHVVAATYLNMGFVNPFWTERTSQNGFGFSLFRTEHRPTTMNSTMLYAFRTTTHLPIPSAVLDMIAAMQMAPVAPVYIKKPNYKKFAQNRKPTEMEWRRDIIAELKATIRTKDDPDYESIQGIVNKVVASNLKDRSKTIAETIGKRDDAFRMRIVNYLFDRGVSMPFYAKLMADMFATLCEAIPAVHEDLQIYCSMDTFNKMFDQTKTIAFPDSAEPNFEDKVCTWNKQKELRRGFGVFAAELHVRGLISEDLLHEALETVLSDFTDNIKKPKNETVSESVDQVVTFLSEMSKLFGKEDTFISEKAKLILAIPKTETHCLGMRSRFKLEDCVRKV